MLPLNFVAQIVEVELAPASRAANAMRMASSPVAMPCGVAAERKLFGTTSTISGSCAWELGRIVAATYEIDTCCLGCGGFLRRFDVDVRQTTLTLELLQVVDGVFFSWSKHDGDDGRELTS